MMKLAPEWVRTSDPVIRSPARYRWTTAPAANFPIKYIRNAFKFHTDMLKFIQWFISCESLSRMYTCLDNTVVNLPVSAIHGRYNYSILHTYIININITTSKYNLLMLFLYSAISKIMQASPCTNMEGCRHQLHVKV